MIAGAHGDCTCCRQWRQVQFPSALEMHELRQSGKLTRLSAPLLEPHFDIPANRSMVKA